MKAYDVVKNVCVYLITLSRSCCDCVSPSGSSVGAHSNQPAVWSEWLTGGCVHIFHLLKIGFREMKCR